jgi:hypothetical protein
MTSDERPSNSFKPSPLCGSAQSRRQVPMESIGRIFLILVLLVAPPALQATSVSVEQGPPATVTKRANDHLFDIYVTPPQGNWFILAF